MDLDVNIRNIEGNIGNIQGNIVNIDGNIRKIDGNIHKIDGNIADIDGNGEKNDISPPAIPFTTEQGPVSLPRNPFPPAGHPGTT